MTTSRSTEVSAVLSTTSATSDSQVVSAPVRLVPSARPVRSRRPASSTDSAASDSAVSGGGDEIVLSTTSTTSESQVVSAPGRPVSSARPRSSRSRRPSSPTAARDLGVVAQVRLAMQPKARLATAVGFLLGGFVPLATYWVSHNELGAEGPLYLRMLTYAIVAGGLLYSARTVFAWGQLAFHVKAKAIGFVVLIEGVMTLSHTYWLSVMALVYLIAINGFATGCNLALPKSQTQPEPEPQD